MRRPQILIVDDDPVLIRFLRANLEARDCEVLTAIGGAEALNLVERELPDLIILDIMMPEMDGFEICQRLREWSQIPILMLSARGEIKDKARCLNLGADDYITKPFGISELLARVRAVLRRTEALSTTVTPPFFTSGDLEINFVQRRVIVAGNEVRLTPTEYNLLQEFVLNADKVLTHTYLLNKIWGPDYIQEKAYLRVFVGRLRNKIESDRVNPSYILTVSGVGYQFKDTA